MTQRLSIELISDICSYLTVIEKLQLVPIFGTMVLKSNRRKICRNKNCDNEQLKNRYFCYNCLQFTNNIRENDSRQLYELFDSLIPSDPTSYFSKFFVVDDKLFYGENPYGKSLYKKYFMDDQHYIFAEHH